MNTVSATMEDINLKEIINQTDITDAYEVKSVAELEFVEKNPELIEVLPFIEFIAGKIFRQPMKFTLELLDEGKNGKPCSSPVRWNQTKGALMIFLM
jgi:hypothetical protein